MYKKPFKGLAPTTSFLDIHHPTSIFLTNLRTLFVIHHISHPMKFIIRVPQIPKIINNIQPQVLF